MWSSQIVGSVDPDEFLRFIRPAGCKILVTERGSFEARCTLIDVDRLHLQRRRERLARLVEVDMRRAGIVFLTEPGPSMFWNGAEIGPDNLALFAPGSRCFSRLSGATSWGSLSLARDDMESVWASHFGSDPTWMAHRTVITPSPAALATLRWLHAAAAEMADASSKSSKQRLSTYGLEQSLIQAMLTCIDTSSAGADTTAVQHHRLIVRRFCEMLELHPAMPLRVPETSHAIGVSGRTLRLACQEQLGVSPTQYLLLRRMRLARRTLQRSSPDVTRVTDVATNLGFWELGRFSVKYRQIFGESPSATLRAAVVH